MRITAHVLCAAIVAILLGAALTEWLRPSPRWRSQDELRMNPEMFDSRPIATWRYPLEYDPRHRNEGH
jgi:hypothetical protein